MEPEDPYVSASDLAEYAYCERAYYYRSIGAPVTPGSGRSARAGQRYHTRSLGREVRRETRGVTYTLLLLLGVAVLIGGAGWVWWRF
jgi:CRISPR/Cas system-associated exonuclease Cas4 (RecB family)